MPKNLIKTGGEIVLAFSMIVAGLFLFSPASVVQAAGYVPLGGEGFGIFPSPAGDNGVQIAKSLVATVADSLRAIIGAISILIIIISSIKLVMSQGEEEVYNKQKTSIIYAIVGLAIVGLAGDLSQILTVENGTFLRDPTKTLKQVRLFNNTVEIVLTMIKYLIGSIATISIVRSGIRMVTLGANEEEMTKDKKNIGWGIVGLLFILLANPIVNNLFYKIDTSKYPGVDALRPVIEQNAILRELVGVTNFIISFVGPAAILGMIAGGILYITAAGEDEKVGRAKKIILWSLIGIVIIYGAFGIVNTIIARKFESI